MIRRKLFLSLFALFFVALLQPISAMADELSIDYPVSPNVSASFDLTDKSNQSHTVVLENGTVAEIGIEYIPNIAPYYAWENNYPNASGTWRIYYNSIIFQEFYIHISNSKITNAWGSNYSAPIVASSEQFTWNSQRAIQRITISIPGVYTGNVFLCAEMNGSTLHTYAY